MAVYLVFCCFTVLCLTIYSNDSRFYIFTNQPANLNSYGALCMGGHSYGAPSRGGHSYGVPSRGGHSYITLCATFFS